MAVSEEGVVCIVVFIMLCIVGTFLCFLGYRITRRAMMDRKQWEKQQYRHITEGGNAQQLYLHATYNNNQTPPSPPAFRPSGSRPVPSQHTPPAAGSPKVPVSPAAAFPVKSSVGPKQNPINQLNRAAQGKNMDSNAAQITESAQMREYSNMATVAEEQAKLERDLKRLENEQYALQNKWEGDVIVKSITGDQYTIPFSSTQTIMDLKNILQQKTNTNAERIRLAFGGNLLIPDDYMLGALRVPSNPTIHMMVKSEKNEKNEKDDKNETNGITSENTTSNGVLNATNPLSKEDAGIGEANNNNDNNNNNNSHGHDNGVKNDGVKTNGVSLNNGSAKPVVNDAGKDVEPGLKRVNSGLDMSDVARAAIAFRKKNGQDTADAEQQLADAEEKKEKEKEKQKKFDIGPGQIGHG